MVLPSERKVWQTLLLWRAAFKVNEAFFAIVALVGCLLEPAYLIYISRVILTYFGPFLLIPLGYSFVLKFQEINQVVITHTSANLVAHCLEAFADAPGIMLSTLCTLGVMLYNVPGFLKSILTMFFIQAYNIGTRTINFIYTFFTPDSMPEKEPLPSHVPIINTGTLSSIYIVIFLTLTISAIFFFATFLDAHNKINECNLCKLFCITFIAFQLLVFYAIIQCQDFVTSEVFHCVALSVDPPGHYWVKRKIGVEKIDYETYTNIVNDRRMQLQASVNSQLWEAISSQSTIALGIFVAYVTVALAISFHRHFAGKRQSIYTWIRNRITYWQNLKSLCESQLGEGEIPYLIIDFADL